ncbi:MAG: alpha-1,2-fucosyltransferase [Lacipirellulaceae bacterium]
MSDIARIAPYEAFARVVKASVGIHLSRVPLGILRRFGYHSPWMTTTWTTLADATAGGDNMFFERDLSFDPAVLSLPRNIGIAGYWQSEKYFSDAAHVLRGELTERTDHGSMNARCLARIRDCESVSVHVRRGDKVGSTTHSATSSQYLESAMSLISDKVASPVFFFFSDDTTWVKGAFGDRRDVIIVDHNTPDRGGHDLMLMAACKHNIIASSSMSWWGAWLNSNSDKVVLSPHPSLWYRDSGFLGCDVLPEGWIVVQYPLAHSRVLQQEH